MGKRYDVLAPRKYTMRDGTEKTDWLRVGVAFDANGGGFSVTMYAVPVPDKETGEIRLVVKEPREKESF